MQTAHQLRAMPCSPHQPHACSGCTAGRTYSAGLFPSPCAGCYTLLSEETPCHQVLDELIVSCWKGYVHFFFPCLGWQWLNEAVLEAHPLAPRWRRECVTHRQKSGQTKGCLSCISRQPSLFSPPLALALCVYLKIHSCQESERVKQKKKVCRAPEIILVHLFFWC